ncbi:restriction endonuclease [Nesterenkonia ebinurensis]|uniref:restriction endonuclease n=1 Tax=Nesterenkonia ebinurensis TaxID=2608252 RepID=UPI00168AD2D4|nr:restriction endonuclease [Nesterenkonia ebinurensis]
MTNRAKVPDKRGNKYEIDVFFEFEIADIQHRVAIECKDHQRPVTRDEVIAFHGKITDMPSTIGVFVSQNGFQQGAKTYLEEHGVKYFDGTSLPTFGNAVTSWLQPVMLPNESAIGQPFWTIMPAQDREPTGSWLIIPLDKGSHTGRMEQDGAVPLFWSKPEALRYQKFALTDDDPSCVRGLEQPALRAMIGLADLVGIRFATMSPFVHDGRRLYECTSWNPQDLADEFVSVGVTNR